ncbi:MAG: signal peptidase I [Actinobacteria bacterium]|nr:signal peptidase I [Actinomycetota bacterium]
MVELMDVDPLRPEPPRPRRSSRTGAHERPKLNQHRSFWLELPILVVIAFGFAFVVKSFLVQPFYIPSGSMENTLAVGDKVTVNKIVFKTREIHRGDIVVFNGVDSFTPEVTFTAPTDLLGKGLGWFGRTFGFAPPDERDFVKRVIGVGGDHVVCCDVSGRVSVNGVALDEVPYLYPGNAPSEQPFDILVPPDKLWVMGDHRAASSDSRAHLGDPGGGFVPVDRVIGRAFAVILPLSHARILAIPPTFDQPGLTKSAAG